MNTTIALFLFQDGLINGAVYALVAVALVLVFAVTKVIFVGQGEFIAYSALTMAALEAGIMPGTIYLLLALGIAAFLLDGARLVKESGVNAQVLTKLARSFAIDILLPVVFVYAMRHLAPMKLGMGFNILATLILIIPMGPLVYRIAFQPLAQSSVLTLFIASIGVHFALLGLGLVFFGAEGFRTTPLWAENYNWGGMRIKGQSLAVLIVTAMLMLSLFLFFGRTLLGKALRATAMNRLGARLVGIPVRATGSIAFGLAAFIGALSGILIGSLTTIYYDSGFLIGLKGFVAAIVAGLVSYPLTVLAALGTGIVEAFSAFFASAFKEVIVFSIILPVLLWRSLMSPHHDEEEE